MPILQPGFLFAVQARRCEFRSAHRLGQPCEQLIGGAGNCHPFTLFLGGKMAIGAGEIIVGRPVSFPYHAKHGVSRCQLIRAAEHRFIQCRVDVLADAGLLAVTQRHQDPQTAVQTGQIIAQRGRARRDRRTLGHSGQIGNTADGVGDACEARSVLVRAGLTVAGHPQHD